LQQANAVRTLYLMAGALKLESTRTGGIDPAALAAAVLAGAFTVFAPPGPWSLGGSLLGITLLLVIWGYDEDPHRNRIQSFAFAAVVALAWILVLGFPLEIAWSTDRTDLLATAIFENPERRAGLLGREVRKLPPEQNFSDVPPLLIAVLWAGIAWFVARRDNVRAEGRRKETAEK
jgi:hypothetical protein